jgi:cell volume regulation protein A
MEVSVIFMVVAAIISIGFFSNYFFKKTKVPDILWLVIFGFLIGPVFHIIEPKIIWKYLPLFSAIALLIMLFDSGSRIDIYKLIKESFDVFLLTVLCFLLTFSSVSLFSS